MTDREALLAAVIANPSDDTVRLIYADFLEESGEAERAEFIRLQIEDAAIPIAGCNCIYPGCNCIYPGCSVSDGRVMWHDPKCRGHALRQRQEVIWNLHLKSDIEVNLFNCFWRRGFIESMVGSLADLLKHGPEIVRSHPVISAEASSISGYEVVLHSATLKYVVDMFARGLMTLDRNPDPNRDALSIAVLDEIHQRADTIKYPYPKCETCDETGDDVTFEPCPYASEIRGYDRPRWICSGCRHSACQDI